MKHGMYKKVSKGGEHEHTFWMSYLIIFICSWNISDSCFTASSSRITLCHTHTHSEIPITL